jgi:hypothetical protein
MVIETDLWRVLEVHPVGHEPTALSVAHEQVLLRSQDLECLGKLPPNGTSTKRRSEVEVVRVGTREQARVVVHADRRDDPERPDERERHRVRRFESVEAQKGFSSQSGSQFFLEVLPDDLEDGICASALRATLDDGGRALVASPQEIKRNRSMSLCGVKSILNAVGWS